MQAFAFSYNFLTITNVINNTNTVKNQYETSKNLNARISIHDKYSTNKMGFSNWIFSNYRNHFLNTAFFKEWLIPNAEKHILYSVIGRDQVSHVIKEINEIDNEQNEEDNMIPEHFLKDKGESEQPVCNPKSYLEKFL